jgi:hypothetical protein
MSIGDAHCIGRGKHILYIELVPVHMRLQSSWKKSSLMVLLPIIAYSIALLSSVRRNE